MPRAAASPALAEIERAVHHAWSRETCDPDDLDRWCPDDPARGRGGVTALVVQDLLGGDLLLADVHQGGTRRGVHYWNRLPDNTEVDLTAEQFEPGETVGVPEVVRRPPDPPRRCSEQYHIFRVRVLDALAAG